VRRREFIVGIGLTGAIIARPIAIRAQQAAMPVIGFLNMASAQTLPQGLSAFLKGLGEAGFVEGQNVRMEYRWAEGDANRLPAMAAEPGGGYSRRQHAGVACREGGDRDNTDRVRDKRRSGQDWPRRQPKPASR
jgi:hypothetical protein